MNNATVEKIEKVPDKAKVFAIHTTSQYEQSYPLGNGAELKAAFADLKGRVAEFEAMIAAAEWIQFENGTISQPCEQSPGECWHNQDEELFDSPLAAYASIAGKGESK